MFKILKLIKSKFSRNFNNLLSKYHIERSTKISTYLGLTLSLLVMISIFGVTIYTMYFIESLFSQSLLDGETVFKALAFRDNLIWVIIIFSLVSLIAAYFLTQIITKPINYLIEGAKKLSAGNFSHRFNKTPYLEVNELIRAFNTMSENLQVLYNDMEEKVKERTFELEKANKEIKSAQSMMVHSEKMRSLGQLVAGITHEINNPVNFIYGNLVYLKDYTNGLLEVIEEYSKHDNQLNEETQKQINEIKARIEYDFIREDLPALIKSCQEGTERTKDIVLNLKNFSRLEEMVISEINLKKEIDTTLNILHNKIKGGIEVIKEYDDKFPMIEGYGGQLNQVFMNIIDNACYAMNGKGNLYIRLNRISDSQVKIEFEDTGSGMEQEQIDKIFEPFFTTKPVGQGTGLGMSISYKVIKMHNGDITIDSKIGAGTKFIITLPIELNKKVEER